LDSYLLSNENDIQAMRALISRLPSLSTIPDFEENIQLDSIKSTTRLWLNDQKLIGFAYVDDYYNLWYELDPSLTSENEIGNEIINWGVNCIKERNHRLHEAGTLDFSCEAALTDRVNLVLRCGFNLQDYRTLRYSRNLEKPIKYYSLPEGFIIRLARGVDEIEDLVYLHRAAFGSEHMTKEERIAMMNAPHYRADLDLVVEASNGDLAAFCVCGFYDMGKKSGFTDPIGTSPKYQRLGLGKAIVSFGLNQLKENGAEVVELGTSSENTPMQKLAEISGFVRVSEKLWFSKSVE